MITNRTLIDTKRFYKLLILYALLLTVVILPLLLIKRYCSIDIPAEVTPLMGLFHGYLQSFDILPIVKPVAGGLYGGLWYLSTLLARAIIVLSVLQMCRMFDKLEEAKMWNEPSYLLRKLDAPHPKTLVSFGEAEHAEESTAIELADLASTNMLCLLISQFLSEELAESQYTDEQRYRIAELLVKNSGELPLEADRIKRHSKTLKLYSVAISFTCTKADLRKVLAVLAEKVRTVASEADNK